MKRIIYFSILLSIGIINIYPQDSIVYIPDIAFLYALIDVGVDTNGDSLISHAEAETITSLDVAVGWREINDLRGIAAFVNLVSLDCGGNYLTNLDLSNNLALKHLACGGNLLTSLDLSNNVDLEYLDCSYNWYKIWGQGLHLNISNCINLKELYCQDNVMDSLDISNNVALTYLDCHENYITSLDVSNHAALTFLDCSNNEISSLDISINNGLTSISFGNMPTLLWVCVWTLPFPPEGVEVNKTGSLNFQYTDECEDLIVNIPDTALLNALIEEEVDINGDSLISYAEADVINSLNISGYGITDMTGISAFISLDTLICSNNSLTSLDLINKTALVYLDCSDNQLTSLDLLNRTPLTYLDCSDNQLSSMEGMYSAPLVYFNFSRNHLTNNSSNFNATALKELRFDSNNYTYLNPSNSTSLEVLSCQSNRITTLDVSNNLSLAELNCSDNQLSTLDVSNNTELKYLSCGISSLTHLDISQNKDLTTLYLRQMPVLNKVCVWTTPFPAEDVTIDTTGSPNVYFSTECGSNTVFIPDTAFLYALIEEGVDTNGDSLISYFEAEVITKLNLRLKGITDMTGLEAFINLDTLDCGCNPLSPFDFSSNIHLKYLDMHNDTYKPYYCFYESTSIDLSKNPELEFLDLRYIGLIDLDISGCTALKTLYCDGNGNGFVSLDVSNNTLLESMSCSYNQLSSLDVSYNIALTYLNCSYNQLTNLDVSNNTGLQRLRCRDNQLTSLNIANDSALIELECLKNQLSSLDLINNTALTELWCQENQLTSLDVSNNTSLERLLCSRNNLTSLDISNNNSLTYLHCGSNSLANLDIVNNILLSSIYIGGMPSLYEVCVWETFLPYLVYTSTTGSPNAYFTTECGANIVNIPDIAFLYALIDEGVDTSGDSLISYAEAQVIHTLDVSSAGIADLTGIEAFVNLDTLNCSDNVIIESPDILKNIALKWLDCSGNLLTGFNVSNNTVLEWLDCSGNDLLTLDVSNNFVLTHLSCEENNLSNLDVSNNSALEWLNCAANYLQTLDISDNDAITYLECWENNLTSLDVSDNTALAGLECAFNRLTSIDVSNNTALTLLRCSANQLTSLDVSNNRGLWSNEPNGNSSKGELTIPDMLSLYKVCVPECLPWEGEDCMPIESEDWLEHVDTNGSPNVFFTMECCDFGTPKISAIDSLYQPDYLRVTSSKNGMIYLVPEDTEKDLAIIREVCMDSLDVSCNNPINISLSSLENGIYWLYARDPIGMISMPESFTILGVGFENESDEDIRIYPNPTFTILNVETVIPDQYIIEITSLNGQLLFNQEMEGTTHRLDLTSFQKGVYFITIRSKGIVATRKIVKL